MYEISYNLMEEEKLLKKSIEISKLNFFVIVRFRFCETNCKTVVFIRHGVKNCNLRGLNERFTPFLKTGIKIIKEFTFNTQ